MTRWRAQSLACSPQPILTSCHRIRSALAAKWGSGCRTSRLRCLSGRVRSSPRLQPLLHRCDRTLHQRLCSLMRVRLTCRRTVPVCHARGHRLEHCAPSAERRAPHRKLAQMLCDHRRGSFSDVQLDPSPIEYVVSGSIALSQALLACLKL